MTDLLPLILFVIVLAAVGVGCLITGVALGRRSAPEPADDLTAALAPVSASLEALAAQVSRAEREQLTAQVELRTELTAQLGQHVHQLLRSSDDARREASRLNSVLSRSGARGRWGEMQLRRLVEAAGLLERVHFDEQQTHRTEDGALRPDMIVNLAGDRCIVVDAKVPLAAFLEAEESQDDDTIALLMQQHAADVVRHIDTLRGKEYQRFVPQNAEFVVMFLPSESLLEAALQARPDLLDHAFARNIVPATPTTLFALLRTVSLTWRQERLAEHAQQIQQLGQELHARLATMAGHLSKLGASLDAAVSNFNKAIGSIESRVLVTARTFTELGVTDTEIPRLEAVTQPARNLAATEFVEELGAERIPVEADTPR